MARTAWLSVNLAVDGVFGRDNVAARRPNHVWNLDLTTVPIGFGFWVPWLPLALPQRRPFCWWVAVVVDHYSRRGMGFEVFTKQPSSAAVQRLLDTAVRMARTAPKYLITDHGRQFTAKTFRRWCRRHAVGQRFGAVGKYGSLAVVERFIKTLKVEGTRRMLVPFDRDIMRSELGLFIRWYNHDRPHGRLHSATPDEVYHRKRPASMAPRLTRPSGSLTGEEQGVVYLPVRTTPHHAPQRRIVACRGWFPRPNPL